MAEVKVALPSFGQINFVDGDGKLTPEAILFLETLWKRTGGGNDRFVTSKADDIDNLTLAKGDILVYDGSVLNKLAVGANGTVLTADSAQATGIKWL